jgi:methylamine methyltransferase corrinoid protein reductive activase
MNRLGIALDLGTSGFRGQTLNLQDHGRILATVITSRHPLPGANVIDHLHFAIEAGLNHAHDIVINAVNRMIDELKVDRQDIERLAVCGNPIQLSLFQEIEIRDLAYAGKRKLEALGVSPPNRDAQILKAPAIRGLNLPSKADVLIPPAVRHEIGADALAMMIKTGMLSLDKIAVVTDYGTNNEMALLANGVVYTGSTAAGPALEGQHIEHGLLALPGAVSDVAIETQSEQNRTRGFQNLHSQKGFTDGRLETTVLDKEMKPRPGDTVDPVHGDLISEGELEAAGITGTGVVALINQALESRLIRLPRIETSDKVIHLPNGLKFTEKDLLEAGKAIGAVRAGHITLCQAAGITPEDIEIAYSSGASGTYVDALKAQQIGMIPPAAKKIYQVGNTSLAMAGDMVRDEQALWNMKAVADDLRQHHCMFAESKVFEKLYILELSYWTEGMPLSQYQKFLEKYEFPPLTSVSEAPEVIKTVERDINDLGERGLSVIADIGEHRSIVFESCTGDMACVYECPEQALTLELEADKARITIDLAHCSGVACRRCERICNEKIFNLIDIITKKSIPIP